MRTTGIIRAGTLKADGARGRGGMSSMDKGIVFKGLVPIEAETWKSGQWEFEAIVPLSGIQSIVQTWRTSHATESAFPGDSSRSCPAIADTQCHQYQRWLYSRGYS